MCIFCGCNGYCSVSSDFLVVFFGIDYCFFSISGVWYVGVGLICGF